MAISSAIGSAANATPAAAASTVASASLAQNFTTFLQLLTTQLKNQNPLEPLDTNQFTQQLVQFAQVEQQMNMNSSLGTLISLQQTAQSTAAMAYVGSTVRVEGNIARLETNGQATWAFASDKAASASFTVTNAAGETVYSENRTITAGQQTFLWNGKTANGVAMPAGDYKVTLTAQDASGQSVAVSTEVEGVVDGVDLTKSPPVLSIGSQTFTLDKVKQVRRTT